MEELTAGLSGDGLHARYQPIVRLSDRQPVGLEVLARFDHPARGTLTPDDFVPQIESAGLSLRLTEAVLGRALSDHVAHLHTFGLWMSVNMPLDVLMQESTPDWLEGKRQQTGLPADMLMIELTESLPAASLTQPGRKALQRVVERLRDLGYALAIDDVGPDMPEPHGLFDLPFTTMKLDKDVVMRANADAGARSFLEKTVKAAKQAGLSIVAEGVTDRETWDRMRATGVDHAQGFLVARPLPAAAVSVWLEGWRQQTI